MTEKINDIIPDGEEQKDHNYEEGIDRGTPEDRIKDDIRHSKWLYVSEIMKAFQFDSQTNFTFYLFLSEFLEKMELEKGMQWFEEQKKNLDTEKLSSIDILKTLNTDNISTLQESLIETFGEYTLDDTFRSAMNAYRGMMSEDEIEAIIENAKENIEENE